MDLNYLYRNLPSNTYKNPARFPPLAANGAALLSAIGTFGSSLLRVHLRVDRERGCTSHAPGTPRATPEPPRRPRARRPHGRRLPAGVLLLWGVSCAQRVVPSFHTGAQGGSVLFFTPLLFVRFTFFKRFLFVAKPFLTLLLQKKTVFYWGTPFFQTVLALDKVWVFV